MIDTIATTESNSEIVAGYRLLALTFDRDISVAAGQFAMLRSHSTFEPLLRRALAVYRTTGPRRMEFLYHVLGRGTQELSQLRRGDPVEALLPLGNSWPIPSTGNNVELRSGQGVEKITRALVVAGGIGSASVLMLCSRLAQERIETNIFFGAAGKNVASGCGLEDFRALSIPMTITTDDGSIGEHGLVTTPLERQLGEFGNSGAAIYACGPWPMMKNVSEIADRFSVPCWVSLEAPMGCGFGVCVGCVVAVKTEEPPGYGSYKRVCLDGPIFRSKVIRWEINACGY
jgi:dihydroorotate dehydrogenase electron transfer subunit